MDKLFSRALAAVAVGLLAASEARAVTTTLVFAGDTQTLDTTSGTFAESPFSYEVASGGVFRAALGGGNPEPRLEGYPFYGVGTVRFFRSDVAGGLFTFDAADVAVFDFDGRDVAAEGFLGGVPQGADTLETLDGDYNWATRSSVNLAGVAIDELRITLEASASFPLGWEALDNVVLSTVANDGGESADGTAIPETATAGLGLIALAALGSALLRRRG